MQNPATYKNGKYNNFMVQESLLDENGNYPVPAASLTGAISCIDYDVATQQYTVDFSIHNRSDASASALSGVPVAFYNGNPESGGSLVGVYRTTADLSAGSTLSALTYSFTAPDITALYMIVNTDKYPIIVADTSYYGIDECDYTDNVFIAPAPKFTDTTQEICQGDSYTFYDMALTASGTYYQEIPNVSGCDSVILALELVVKNCPVKCDLDSTLCYSNKKFDSDFIIQIEKQSESQTSVSNFQSPILFDLNGDCIPEIITTNNDELNDDWLATKNIDVFDSRTMIKIFTIKTDFFIYQLNNFIICDVDKDLTFEIIVPIADILINPTPNRGKLICYNLDGSIKWVSDKKFGQNVGFANQGSVSVSDFNSDLIPEVYIYNEIFNAQNGIKLVDGGLNGCGLSYASQTIAANLDDNPNDLE
jgi:hypothetical protein